MFDGSILVDRTRGEVAARCDSEAANVLGLDMVHELVTGKRTVQEARHTSEQNTVAYNGGREAPYAERLLFDVPQGGTEDLDESHLAGAVLQQAVGKLKTRSPPGAGGGHRPAHPQLTHDYTSDASFDAAGWLAGGRPSSSLQGPIGSALGTGSVPGSGLTGQNPRISLMVMVWVLLVRDRALDYGRVVTCGCPPARAGLVR